MNKNKYYFILLFLLFIPFVVNAQSIEMTGTEVNVRSGPGTKYTAIGQTGELGETYTLKTADLIKDEGGCGSGYWFNVDYKGSNGYICSTYAIIKVDQPIVITDEARTQCEAELKNAGFPVSYWTSLCTLKVQHPNWTFQSVYTGYDFASAVAKEQCRGSIKTTRTEFQDNTCGKTYDSGYTGASQTANAYYMNPLNFLNEKDIFMFESAYINESVKPYYSQLASKISNSTLVNRIPDLPNYIANASPQSNASATFLAARIRVELGSGLLSSGNYAGQLQSALSGNYTSRYGYYYSASTGWSKDATGRQSVNNYYNFYNIGASDGDGITQKALAYAVKQGWGGAQYDMATARQLAVTGGAGWTYRNYINAGQQTMYFNKWNFNPETQNHNHSIASHQYMTNVQAPLTEGNTLYNAYKSLNLLNLPFVFVIPVYANLNADIQNTPGGATGDTNNDNTNLAPATMVVSSGYVLNGSYINNITKNTSIDDLVGRISSQGGTVEVYSNNNRLFDGLVCTGMTIRVISSTGESTYTAIVKGDPSGDGKVNALDLLQMQKSIIGEKNLPGVNYSAADVSGDGKVNALDLLQVQKNILGLKDL